MRIVEVIPELIQAGAERFIVDLCNQLVQTNEVYLVVLYPIDAKQTIVSEIDDRVKVVSVNKKLGSDVSVIFRLNKLFRQIKPDVVHSHLYSITYLFPAFMTQSRVSFLHTIHSHAAREAESGVKKWARKYAFSHHKVWPVTISEESQQSFLEFYGLDSKLIYNGRPAMKLGEAELQAAKIEIENTRVSADSVAFINVARILGVKNQVALAEAIDSMSKTGCDVELFIVGDAHDKTMKEQILSLNNSRIHLLGLKKEPRAYMKYADAFVLSSKMEGMPITLIEAFSIGVIPVCTAVGGVKNMIQDGVNGLLIKTPQEEDIVKALKRFLKLTEEERAQMAMQAKQSYEKFDIVNSAANYESYMKELVRK